MKVLKALANTLLGFLLLLCLTLLSFGVALNSTLLSSRFINKQIDRLPVTALVDEAIQSTLSTGGSDDYQGVIQSAEALLARHEAELKQAAEAVVSDVYGYVVSGRALDFEATLRRSVLDSKLANGIIDDLDLSDVITQILTDMVPSLPLSIDPQPYLAQLVPVVEPWLKTQLKAAVPVFYDYLLNEKPEVTRLTLPVDEILEKTRLTLREAVLKSPPPSLASYSPSALADLFDTGWQEIAPEIPVAFEIDLMATFNSPGGIAEIPPGAIMTALAEAQPGLQTAQQVIGYYHLGFWLLVVLTLLVIAGIVLLNRLVAGSRVLGGTLLGYGLLELAGLIFSFSFWHSQAARLGDLPQALLPWLIGLGDSTLRAMLIFPIVCAVVGLGLLVFSFLYRRAPDAQYTQQQLATS